MLPSKKIFTFIDFLGFKNHCQESHIDTSVMLDDMSQLLKDHYRKNKNDKVNTFEYFIPVSDSVVILSAPVNIKEFCIQLSLFLMNAFLINAPYYPTDRDNGAIQVRNNRGSGELNFKSGSDYPGKDYPLLWRGGLSINIVEEKTVSSVKKGVLDENASVFIGKACVDAIELEKKEVDGEKIKGPRLIIDDSVYEKLKRSEYKYVMKIKDNIYEILWPAEYFAGSTNDADFEEKFREIFQNAAYLWMKNFYTPKVAIHYKEFLFLIIRSVLVFCGADVEKINIVKRRINSTLSSDDIIPNVFLEKAIDKASKDVGECFKRDIQLTIQKLKTELLKFEGSSS